MINEVIETLKAYTDGKDNAGKVEISVMQLNRIIKALEQQPTDAVDRQRVLEIIEREEFKGDALFEIEMLAPVTPQPNKWIPCSEKLPEVGQRVIATVESIDGNYVRETICGKYGLLCGNGIAWMPLPEPYKSEIPTGAEGSDKE